MKITGIQLKRMKETLNEILNKRDVAETMNCVIELYCSKPKPIFLDEQNTSYYEKIIEEVKNEPWYSSDKDDVIKRIAQMAITYCNADVDFAVNMMVNTFDAEEYRGIENFSKEFVKNVMPYVTVYDSSFMKDNEYVKKIYELGNISQGAIKISMLPVYEKMFFSNGDCEEVVDMFTIPLGYAKEKLVFPSIVRKNDNAILYDLSAKEINLSEKIAEKVHGNILILGGGFGYFEYLASQKDDVKKIRTYVPDEYMCKMMENYIMPLMNDKVALCSDDDFEEGIGSTDYDYIIFKTNGKLETYFKCIDLKNDFCNESLKAFYMEEQYPLESIKSILCIMLGESIRRYEPISEEDITEIPLFTESISKVNSMRSLIAARFKDVEIKTPDDIKKLLSYSFIKETLNNK